MTRLLALFLAASGLAGCAGGDGDEGTPAAAAPAPGAHQVVGQFVMKVRPKAGKIEIARLADVIAGAPRALPENLANLPIVSDGTTGSGPNNTVELATTSTVDTYNTGASGSCPASSFCADVQLTHFYPGLNLSAVYVQVTAITGAGGITDTTHGVSNGIASTPFGVDVSKGAWQYTSLPGSLGYGKAATQTWIFKNPDDGDYDVYLNATAALYPTLWLKNGSIVQTAPLVAGQPATIHYEYARNTGCSSATSYVWNGFFKATNTDTRQFSFQNGTTDTYFDLEVTMPFGGGLDFWFNKQDLGSSCTSWDSNNGNNYNYGLTGNIPAVHFGGPNTQSNPYWTTNWNVYADSGVKAGATITVDYEVDRVVCGGVDRYGRVPSGVAVTMNYRYDSNSGAYTAVPLLGLPYGVSGTIKGQSGQMFVPPTITIPTGAKQLWIYFESTGPNNCHNYDSGGGSNFSFNL